MGAYAMSTVMGSLLLLALLGCSLQVDAGDLRPASQHPRDALNDEVAAAKSTPAAVNAQLLSPTPRQARQLLTATRKGEKRAKRQAKEEAQVSKNANPFKLMPRPVQ